MSYSDYNATKSQYIVPSSDRVYSDLDLALTKHPVYDDIRPLTDIDAVKNSVRNLLLTNKGERPFQPNVGSGIFALLFEHANMYTYEAVRNNIQDMLYSYEPRINQVKVKIDANDEKNEMHVTVGFNITGVASDETVDFYLERLR
jgi:hypothetical protein